MPFTASPVNTAEGVDTIKSIGLHSVPGMPWAWEQLVVYVVDCKLAPKPWWTTING